MGLTRPRAAQIYDIDYKQSVRVITTSNITLSGGAPTVVDGVTLSLNDRILVTGQSTASQNGIYTVSVLGTGSNGTWIRSTDTNATGELDSGTIVMVTEGSSYADTSWKLTTNDPIVIGTTALTFEINTGNAFGTISANGTSVISNSASGTVTFSTGNNIVITGNAGTDTITFAVKDNPTFIGNVTAPNFIGNLAGTANVANSILVTESSDDNVTYNVPYVSPSGSAGGYRSLLTDDTGLTFNPGTNTLTVQIATHGTAMSAPNVATTTTTGTTSLFTTITSGTLNIMTGQTSGPLTIGGTSATGAIAIGRSTATQTIAIGNGVTASGSTKTISIGTLGAAGSTTNISVGPVAGNGTVSFLANAIVSIANSLSVSGNANITGNVSGANLLLSGNIFDSGTSLQINTTSAANIALAPNSSIVLVATTTGANITGTLNATGNANVGNLGTAGAITATGNITGGNLTTTGTANIGTLTVNGGSTFTGNLLPSANVTYNIGSPTQRWKEIFLAANTIDIGGALISADIATGSLILTGPDGAEFILTGTSPTTSVGQFGMIEISNAMSSHNTTTGALTVVGGAGIGGNINVGGIIDVVGNSIYLGNLLLKDNGSNIFGLYASDGTTPATISQSSVDTTKISNGTSNVQVVSANSNVTIGIAGTSNVLVVSSSGANVAGTLGVTGNITGGNVSGTLLTGTLTTAAQPNVTSLGTLNGLTISGNLSVAGNVSITGNVNYANVTDLVVGDPLIFLGANNTSNLVDLGFIVTYDDGVDQHGGWVRDATDGTWKLFGNVVPEPTTTVNFTNAVYQPMLSGAITSTGSVSATGNVTGANVTSNALVSTVTLSVTGNANVGNLGTAGVITATGNITGRNLTTGAQVVATGNITGGNIVTAGQVIATGNIHGALIKASSNVEIQNRGILYLNDSDNSNYIGLRSPATLTGNYTYIFPTGYGNADQVLSTNGSGGLSWVDQTGGGGGSSATSYPNSTVSPVPGSTGNFDLSFNFVQTSQETPFESSATDAFGVNLGEVYSMMDPGGEVLEPVDLGILT